MRTYTHTYKITIYELEGFNDFGGFPKIMYNFMCTCGFSSYVDSVYEKLEQKAKNHLSIHTGEANKFGWGPCPIYITSHPHKVMEVLS